MIKPNSPHQRKLENMDKLRNVHPIPVSQSAMGFADRAYKSGTPETSIMGLAYLFRSLCESSGIHPDDLLGMAGQISSEQGGRLTEFRAVDRLVREQLINLR